MLSVSRGRAQDDRLALSSPASLIVVALHSPSYWNPRKEKIASTTTIKQDGAISPTSRTELACDREVPLRLKYFWLGGRPANLAFLLCTFDVPRDFSPRLRLLTDFDWCDRGRQVGDVRNAPDMIMSPRPRRPCPALILRRQAAPSWQDATGGACGAWQPSSAQPADRSTTRPERLRPCHTPQNRR